MNPDEIKLPETVEEFQKALAQRGRDGFISGAQWGVMYGDPAGPVPPSAEVFRAARREFPIRKKVPRVVEVQRSAIRFFARVSEKHNGVSFYLDRECREPFNVLGLHAHEPAIYADLIANPFTYEEE